MEESSESKARQSEAPADERLDSWKGIATYLDRDVRTVQRWEQEEGLPIRRHIHNTQVSVYAYRSEIDNWLGNRSSALENDRPDGFRFFSENKKTVVGVASGVTLFLLVGLVAWMDIGSSSNPEGLNFQQRDWVLIADFENRTGESVFDGVLESALLREIANSRFVNVVPRERIEDTLRLMRKPLDTRIDPKVAREISLRDGGIKALLTGRVEKLDSTYLLSVQLIDPSTGQSIAATSEEAAGQSEVLSTLRFLSSWSRETLGEKLAVIQESEKKLEKVTTPSLQAVQLFTDARTLFDRGPELRRELWLVGRLSQGPAEEFLRQAVEIDPEFASAYIWLAWTLQNQGKSFDDYIKHAERAFQLAGTTSERERYFIQGSYYQMKGERDSAIHAFEALLGLYPDHFWATTKLVRLYSETGQDQEALIYRVRLADLRPSSFIYTSRAALRLLRGGDLAKAKTYVTRAVGLITPQDIDRWPRATIPLMWVPAFEALLHAGPETALREADRSLERLRSVEGGRFVNYSPMGAFYLTLGQIEQARKWFEETTEPGVGRQMFLAAIAYVQEDHKAMTEHLEQALKARESRRRIRRGSVRDFPPFFQLLLARGGLLSETNRNAQERRNIRQDNEESSIPRERLRRLRQRVKKGSDILRGVLALNRGNRIEGLRMLGDALSSISLTDSGSAASYFMGSEILAEAWREQGDSTNAAEVLRTALEKEAFLLLDKRVLTGPLWLKLQAQLSQLYREMGQDEDARKIEDKLRRLLALADPDHPILRQLDHTQDLALREAAN